MSCGCSHFYLSRWSLDKYNSRKRWRASSLQTRQSECLDWLKLDFATQDAWPPVCGMSLPPVLGICGMLPLGCGMLPLGMLPLSMLPLGMLPLGMLPLGRVPLSMLPLGVSSTNSSLVHGSGRPEATQGPCCIMAEGITRFVPSCRRLVAR